ncbi:MAG: hypothetical protein DA408_07555 [Bacteroidetes bacterium]|nr:MAG: hypothetical protein C7N36_15170 [Bacteroidota bacterium]PTM13240.1 MAG: hypothetical protein DA408_07555 [Bacteroidota bacterium]
MMKGSFQLGRIARIPIQFHWTFLLVGLWLLYDSWQPGYGMNWDNFRWLFTWVGMVFLAVLLHELGHALMARRLGIGTERIVLYPIGGGAFLEELPEDARREILIALAGPGVNFVLAGMVAPFLFGLGDTNLPLIFQLLLNPNGNIVIFDASPWEYLVVVFFLLNLLLGVFNLLPAFPLDGGRVLRALLSIRWPRGQATIIAARVGMVGAVLLLGVGAYLQDVFFALGAFLIFGLARLEVQVQQRRNRLAQARVRDYLDADYRRLYLAPDTSLTMARETIADWSDGPIVLLDVWQQPHGVTSKTALLATNLDNFAHRPIGDLVGSPQWVGLHPDEDLLRAAEKLDEHKLFAFPVIDHYGRILGLLDRQVVRRVMEGK